MTDDATDDAGVFYRRIEQHDHRLGRNIAHDPRSRAFAATVPIDKSLWRDKAIRIYDPTPNPNQCHGECTGCAKMMQLNAAGNRKTGRILKMADAHRHYARNTELDPYEGTFTFDPASGAVGGEDTGSNGLASCQSAQQLGTGGRYEWEFRGADGVVQQIMQGRVISVGTRWDWDMFDADADGRIHLGGGEAGGHQYVLRGYWKSRDWVQGRCWWGDFRDFWIARADLDELLANYGDAHWQQTA